uniref:Gamma-glutamyltransferase n=1 Tax=Globodera rostochiensis TaxID=31243 RepID=A0A914IDE2_GLORO
MHRGASNFTVTISFRAAIKCARFSRFTVLAGVDAPKMFGSECIGVTNAQSSGLGGGMILTFYDAQSRSCKVIDARETAPASATDQAYEARVANRKTPRATGYHEIATPGELAGLWMAYKEFGSGRVPWSELVMPAAKLALYGFPVTEHMRTASVGTEAQIFDSPSMKSWINQRTNKLYEFGDLIKRPELAKTLERLAAADDPIELFYEGEMADEIVEEMERNGAFLSRLDLKNYKPHAEGNAVSVTSSINQWFGAVVQSDKLGIVWNDQMEDFSFPGVENCPMVIYDKHTGKVKIVIGGSGGAKIPSSIAKAVLRVLCLNETIKEAIDSPLLHNQFTPNEVVCENGTSKQLMTDLKEQFGHNMKPYDNNSVVVQAIHVAEDGFIYANGDFRRRTYMHPAGF